MKQATGRTILQAAILLLFILVNMPMAQADVLQGRVLDAETGEPLDGAHVEVTEEVPDFCTFHMLMYTDSLGRFHFSCVDGSRITLRARFFGYKTNVLRMNGSDTGDTIRISDIRLQPSQALMQEVLVKGRQRRF